MQKWWPHPWKHQVIIIPTGPDAVEISMSPCVCDFSGDLFKVQLRNRALRSEKSHLLEPHISICLSMSVMSLSGSTGYGLDRQSKPKGYHRRAMP